MKKIVLTAFLLTSVTVMVSAQGLHLGAKAGANLTKIDGQAFKDGFQLGYHLGGFLEVDFSKSLGIQPEVLFNQYNTKYAQGASSIIDNISDGSKKSFNYLTIPILLRINAGNLLTFHLGPQFGILLNNEKSLVQNGKDAFKSGDLAAVAGAQLNLGSLRVYGRYNIGLSNISDIDNTDKWKNQTIQLGVGFKIL